MAKSASSALALLSRQNSPADSPSPGPEQNGRIELYESPHGTDTCKILDMTLKKNGEGASVVGICKIKVLDGLVSVYGMILQKDDGWHYLRAPAHLAVPVVKAISRNAKVMVEEISPEDDESAMFYILRQAPPYSNLIPRHFVLYGTNMVIHKRSLLESPPSWESTISSISKRKGVSTSVFVVGPWKSGKTTFATMLCNNAVSQGQQVFYAEFDVNQPIAGAPGMISLNRVSEKNVSLFGSFVERQNMLCVRSIGYDSSRAQPELYVGCCQTIFEYWRKNFPSSLLVVNTPGCNDTGGLIVDQLEELKKCCRPTQVVSIGGNSSFLSNDLLLESVQTSTQASVGRVSTADIRHIQMMLYFHHGSSLHMTEMKPWQYSFANVSVGILEAGDMDLDDYIMALNGTIVTVYLLNGRKKATSTKEGLQVITSNDYLKELILTTDIYDYAIVQAFNPGSKCLRLIFPNGRGVDSNDLVLVRGRLELPVWDMWREGQPIHSVPYLVPSKIGKNDHVWKARKGIKRKFG